MWRFQHVKLNLERVKLARRNLSKRNFLKADFLNPKQLFLIRLLSLSVLFHLIFLFGLLVVYSGYRYSTKLIVNRSGVQLLPAYFVNQSASPTMHVGLAKGVTQPIIKKAPAKKMPSTVMKKAETKRPIIKKQTQPVPLPKKQPPAQKQKPKEEPKKSPEKQQAKQQATKKQLQPAQKDTKKAEQQSNQTNHSQAEKNDAHAVQPIIPLVAQEERLCQENEAGDFDTPQIQQFIQREVSKHWMPPIGLPDELVCQITIQIGGDGAVIEALIEESSGVLVYDLSARSVAMELSLPRWAWGKEFTISFCQE